MGMAASQARYIALTARKSNVEYEGQQINQARLALANQSANLFNQMMGMGVPTPPSTTDFTTVQYSFSDGVNTEVLSNFYQLGNSDSEYNYVVTTYHNEKVYTGSKKMLNDPQVQATQTNHFTYKPQSTDDNTEMNVAKAWKNTDGTYGMQPTDGSTSIFRPVTAKEEDQVRAINKGNGLYEAQAAAGDAQELLTKVMAFMKLKQQLVMPQQLMDYLKILQLMVQELSMLIMLIHSNMMVQHSKKLLIMQLVQACLKELRI